MLVHTTWDTCAVHVYVHAYVHVYVHAYVHVYVRVHVFYDLQLLLVEWNSEKSLIEKDVVIVDCCCG